MLTLFTAFLSTKKLQSILIGLLLAAIVFFIVKFCVYIVDLNTQIKQLTVANSGLVVELNIAHTNFDTCQSANVTQQSTIDSLLAERKDNEAAVAALAAKKKIGDDVINTLKARLAVLNLDQANNGPVANNLRETIKSIQNKEKLQ